ncbi:MAG: nitrite reductase small subunit NirD [Paludibacter sp.]|nr:nitrite reductase small subunit NirD [Paludibacter sp.]
MTSTTTIENPTKAITWHKTVKATDVPENGGVAALIDGQQIAIFNFTEKGEWYACQNLCPHKMEMALSRGLIGDANGEPKVACPFHKKSFSLETGECLNDSCNNIDVFPVKIEGDMVFVGL